MPSVLDRIDPSQMEPGQLARLMEVLSHSPSLVGREGFRIELPDPIFHLLLKVVESLRKGESLILMPEDETLTSQAAADLLGVSRPHLTKLTDRGEIPFERVGRHRRILLRDLQEYMDRRGKMRRALLDEAYQSIDDSGLYDRTPTVEDWREAAA